MKYGTFWNVDSAMKNRRDRNSNLRLPMLCCAKCSKWIQFKSEDDIGWCTKDCTPDYDYFSWADDLCDDFKAAYDINTNLNWRPLTKETYLINGHQYLLASNDSLQMEVGRYYIGEREFFIIWGMCEERDNYDYVADIYLPNGTFCES